MKTDILIAGCGCAGLYCALHLPRNKTVTVITKSDTESSDSFLAQGGICVLKNEDDYDAFFEDTLKAGHGENDTTSVSIMIKESGSVIEDLLAYGTRFARNDDGSLLYTKEGAHSDSRILYHKDITGKEITESLLREARKRKNIRILEHTTLWDILERDGICTGAVLELADGRMETVQAEYTVLATGGIGGLFRHSTNFRHLTGDAIAIAAKHNVKLRDMNYIQIHPTTLYTENSGERSFLISESVRGEGAMLYNKQMERFTDELLPRDLLTKEIYKQMEQDGTEHVWEDLRTIPEEERNSHFPNILSHCMEKNYDANKECIPVVPAQHYFMGGIRVDYDSKTSMEGLYAIGETACNGVHGKNRLASNSLLESLVFAKRAAHSMAEHPRNIQAVPETDMTAYADKEALKAQYSRIVLDEIEKAKKEKGE